MEAFCKEISMGLESFARNRKISNYRNSDMTELTVAMFHIRKQRQGTPQ